jgi:very-short-patch-repair endonuclease
MEAQLRTQTLSPKRQSLLTARAAEMRVDPSPPEQQLWAALTNRKLGVSFRRQVPLAGYICDFVCASHRLIVEVDGAQHARHRAADARRDGCLRRLGYGVLRLQAKLVLNQPASAVAVVVAALAE